MVWEVPVLLAFFVGDLVAVFGFGRFGIYGQFLTFLFGFFSSFGGGYYLMGAMWEGAGDVVGWFGLFVVVVGVFVMLLGGLGLRARRRV